MWLPPGCFMVFFHHGQEGLHGMNQVWNKLRSRDLWPGNEPMFSTWAQSQISTHTTQIKISLRNKVDHQPHKDRNRKGGGGGEQRNKDICWFLMDSVERQIYFKVNVWQFRWNTVSLSSSRWKRTGEDERIKQRAGGRKRELCRYLSLGTHRKT